MARIVVKKLGSPTGGRMFEFTRHASELGIIAGTLPSWKVWVQSPEGIIDTGYGVVFAATNNNQHDRLNFRPELNLSKKAKTRRRFDNLLRQMFGIPKKLEFRRAEVTIMIAPALKRVIVRIHKMEWN